MSLIGKVRLAQLLDKGVESEFLQEVLEAVIKRIPTGAGNPIQGQKQLLLMLTLATKSHASPPTAHETILGQITEFFNRQLGDAALPGFSWVP